MSLKVGNKVRESGPTSYLGNLQKWGEKQSSIKDIIDNRWCCFVRLSIKSIETGISFWFYTSSPKPSRACVMGTEQLV